MYKSMGTNGLVSFLVVRFIVRLSRRVNVAGNQVLIPNSEAAEGVVMWRLTITISFHILTLLDVSSAWFIGNKLSLFF